MRVFTLSLLLALIAGPPVAAAPAQPEGSAPSVPAVPAAAPILWNYTGQFTDDLGEPIAGPVKLTFRLHGTAEAGPLLWEETHTNVTLRDGVGSVLLGSKVGIPIGALARDAIYLGIRVNDADELQPRLRVASVPYALDAARLDGKSADEFEPRGAVLALSLSDGSPPNQGQNRVHWDVLRGMPEGFADGEDTGVTDHGALTGLEEDGHPQYAREADLAASAGAGPNDGKNLVHWENLVGVPSGFADGADNTAAGETDHGDLDGLLDDDHPQYVLEAELTAHVEGSDPHPAYVPDAEFAEHVGDATAHHTKTVSASELTSGTLDVARLPVGGIGAAQIADGGVTTTELADLTVAESDLAANSVTGAKVVDGSLGGADLGLGSVAGDRLAPGSITSVQLSSGAFDSTNIANGGLSSADLADSTLTGINLAAAAVDSVHIAPGAVDSVHLAPGAVGAGQLAPGSVGSAALAVGAVGTDAVADESLTSADIDDGSLLATDLHDEAGVDGASVAGPFAVGTSPQSVTTANILPPANGWVLATLTATACSEGPGGGVATLAVSLSTEENTLNALGTVTYRTRVQSGDRECVPLAAQLLVPAVGGELLTVHVVADGEVGVSNELENVSVALLYLPTRY